MPNRTFVALGVSGLAVLIVVGLAQCASSQPAMEAALSPSRPECPRHDQMLAFEGKSLIVRPTRVAAAGLISAVPEYHDCQRLMVYDGDQRKFGPLVAIFARFGLETLADPPAFVAPSVRTKEGTAARGTQQGSGLKMVTTGSGTGLDTAVVTILDYDEAYPPLHIPPGYSCLYVYHKDTTWAARLVQAPDDSACLSQLDPRATGWDLGVVATPDPNPPAATRWDWDRESKEHYIGVRCGSSWCEVYNERKTHVPSSSYGAMGKGWYDEQYLAENSTGPLARDGLAPGIPMGTIFPIGDLADHDEAFYAVMQPVALVALAEPSGPYANKLSFAKGPAPNGQTLVSLCKGDKRDCVPWLHTANGCPNVGDAWWARIASPTGTKYRCVIRRLTPPGAPLPPGVVRWRWKLQDEGMWIRCPGGCCEVT